MQRRFLAWFGAASVCLTLCFCAFACRKKEGPKKPEDPAKVFDKQALVNNYADNLILPALVALEQELDSLNTQAEVFFAAPNASLVPAMQEEFLEAWQAYQQAGVYAIGPGDDQGIRVNYNIFPTDTSRINANAGSGVYDLQSAANVSAKGFPALDFLFFGKGESDQQIASRFAFAGRIKYARDLIAELRSRTVTIRSEWQNSYRGVFVSSLGTDVGSSIGFLVNQMNFELDYLKNAKIATPVGLRSGGAPLPDNAEAFYSGRSLQYALATLDAIEDVYLGRSPAGANGSGFDDYLVHLGAQHVNGPLHDAIMAQFSVARNKLQAIPPPLSVAVTANKATVEDAYRELVKLLALLKTDLPSSLGVMITYQDGDGD